MLGHGEAFKSGSLWRIPGAKGKPKGDFKEKGKGKGKGNKGKPSFLKESKVTRVLRVTTGKAKERIGKAKERPFKESKCRLQSGPG